MRDIFVTRGDANRGDAWLIARIWLELCLEKIEIFARNYIFLNNPQQGYVALYGILSYSGSSGSVMMKNQCIILPKLIQQYSQGGMTPLVFLDSIMKTLFLNKKILSFKQSTSHNNVELVY